MSLEEMIAAERATPPAPSEAESKSVWRRIRAGAGSAVPPAAFDVSPAATTVTLKAKLAAVIATTTGKIAVAAIVTGGAIGGVAAAGAGAEAPELTAEVAAPVRPPVAADRNRAVANRDAAEPDPEPVPAPEPEPEPEPEPVPVPEETPAVEAPATIEATPTVEAPPAEETEATASKRPKPRRTFGEELALIRKAQRALAGGHHSEALRILGEHKQSFPRGSMREDRSALRALALCLAGRTDAGRREAQRFARRYPRSLYADRVEEACL